VPHQAIKIRLRPLERTDLRFIHTLDNNDSVMRFWFEEAYEAYDELNDLYGKHIHDQTERRFIIEASTGESVGLVELMEINSLHRRAEFGIVIAPEWQGRGVASAATRIAVDYAFSVLNLYKLYLIVDSENSAAIHIYLAQGFVSEGTLVHEFFINGGYRDVVRMYMLQSDYLKKRPPQPPTDTVLAAD
jgi:diamine N-acetyltransferase